jgi:hypothetical protein
VPSGASNGVSRPIEEYARFRKQIAARGGPREVEFEEVLGPVA